MYAVELAVRVQRSLDKMDAKTKLRIEKRLKRLESEAVPSDARCLGRQDGQSVFRYRIGNYRVLYTVDEVARVVLVHKIAKRSKVYS